MIRAVVFHLGDFKTGSTAIQTWLARHGAARGLYLPVCHTPLALAQSLGNTVLRGRLFGDLARELARAKGEVAVISAEHFEYADPANLAAVLAMQLPQHDCRLVAYVRPHPQALLSRYAESIKIGSFTGSLDAYLDWPQTLRQLHYAPRFARWRAAFGDRFVLRLYDRARFAGGDVLSDALGCFTGREVAEVLPGLGRVNPQPGTGDLAMLVALHRAIGPLPAGSAAQAARWTLGRHLGRLIAQEGTADTPLALDRALAQRLHDRFGADADALDAAFFADAPLRAALDAARAAAPQSLPGETLPPEAQRLARIIGETLRSLLDHPDGPDLFDRAFHERHRD